jgi:hypothetical protein
MESVTLKISADMIAAIRQAAVEDDVTTGQIIREALTRELRRRHVAKTAVRPDEQLVAPLRALLADDFAYAKSWSDLQERLARKGHRLVEAGGGLALHDLRSGARLCKGSDLGYGYAALMRKFSAPFPGHAHHWLFDRVKQDLPPSSH